MLIVNDVEVLRFAELKLFCGTDEKTGKSAGEKFGVLASNGKFVSFPYLGCWLGKYSRKCLTFPFRGFVDLVCACARSNSGPTSGS